MASRRKRGPAALRPWLSSGLPLSDVVAINAALTKTRQFGYVRKLDSVLGLLGGMTAMGHKRPLNIILAQRQLLGD
jgi:hypothetical protein